MGSSQIGGSHLSEVQESVLGQAEKEMRKTFLYRARINREAEANCNQWIELCRTLYNLALEQRIYAYRQQKKAVSAYAQMAQLPEFKREFPEFKTVGSQVLQDVLARLDKAYKAFFRRCKQNNGKAGFPRFRGRDSYNSFTLKQAGWKRDGRYLYVKGLGRFKLFFSRPIEGVIKTITISRRPSGKWFVAFSCDKAPINPLPKTGGSVGIDVGCESFLTDSNGDKVENPRWLDKSQSLLEFRQQTLSRKTRGSSRRRKARVQVARLHEKIANQRRDFHFKTALKLVRENDAICIEKMNGWSTDWRKLNRSMRDVAWFGFFSILKAKATEAAREIVEVPARNTSRTCSGCGYVQDMPLEQREFRCLACSLVLHRDHNAALNIFRAGQALRAIPRIFRL